MILYSYLKANVGYRTGLILETYCSKWKLHVNVEKLKVLILDSNGKSCTDKPTYNENLLKIVLKYCYLGLTLKCNGRF